MDGLEEKAYNELLYAGESFEAAEQKTAARAKSIFEERYLGPLKEVKNCPAQIVQLRGTWWFFCCCSLDSITNQT
jgi:hypothetical protein